MPTKKSAEAELLLLSAYEGMKQREGNIRDRNKLFPETLQRLVQLYEATARPAQATEWKKKLTDFNNAEAAKQAAAPSP